MTLEQERNISSGPNVEIKKGGVRLANAHHLLLMALPNILNPHKLAVNIRHPIHEVFHTGHSQYPLGESATYVVEHVLFERLVTVDVIEEDTFPKGFIPRARQLFRRDFYYGHCEYFPQPFRLVERKYINGGDFNLKEYLEQHKR